MSGAFVRAGEPVDLENCHREPIHIPASIQPHGCLLALDPGSLEVLVASANCADFVGADPDRAVGASLADLLGDEAASQIAAAAGGPRLGTTLLTVVGYDVLVHESEGALMVELLRGQGGARPLTFTDTYRRAQTALSELNEGLDYERLLERLTAAAVHAGPSEEECDALVDACRDPEAQDDATVLVVRRT